MQKFFEIFGKVMLVIIILSSLTYGGYYFGKQTKSITKPEALNTSVVEENVAFVTPTPTNKPSVTLVAGVNKSAGLSFDQYSVMTPTDWISKKESQTTLDEKLTLTKDGYEISIFQAATGGALCLYPGDADFEGPSSKFEVFTNLITKDGKILRKSSDKAGVVFTICQKSADGSYLQPTNYGHISIKLPTSYTTEILTEIDSIISSLKKI